MDSVDRKRLRELAMDTASRGYCSVSSSDLLAILDALEAEQRDARRFRYWFSPDAKTADINEYLRGVREHWTLAQWRACLDRAIAEQEERTFAAPTAPKEAT